MVLICGNVILVEKKKILTVLIYEKVILVKN